MPEKTSTKGLDGYANQFLGEKVISQKGDAKKASDAEKTYQERVKEDFIRAAGAFTEDLVAYLIDQKQQRNLDDRSVIFALALANINLRDAYCSIQNEEEKKDWSPAKEKEKSKEWDAICWAAQRYFNENS